MSEQQLYSGRSAATPVAYGKAICLATVFLLPRVLSAAPPTAPPPGAISAAVRLSDLHLLTPEGLKEAQARIRAVALHLCHTYSDVPTAAARARYEECVREAVADAQQRLRSSTRIAGAVGRGGAR